MRLIDADAFREDYALAERCEDCQRHGKKDCDYPYYSARDFCGWLDDAPTVSGWISVKDRLPDETEDVIVLYEWTGLSGNKYREITLTNLRAFVNTVNRIIAWMPLPTPPEVHDEV